MSAGRNYDGNAMINPITAVATPRTDRTRRIRAVGLYMEFNHGKWVQFNAFLSISHLFNNANISVLLPIIVQISSNFSFLGEITEKIMPNWLWIVDCGLRIVWTRRLWRKTVIFLCGFCDYFVISVSSNSAPRLCRSSPAACINYGDPGSAAGNSMSFY